jgi:hypothetical protein
MAWSDIFIPSGSQTADEKKANYERQQAQYLARLQERQAAATITPEQFNQKLAATQDTLNSQDAAAVEGFQQGLQEGLGNVTGAVKGTLAGAINSIWASIPWQAWAVGAVALFLWMGGLAMLKGRLKS